MGGIDVSKNRWDRCFKKIFFSKFSKTSMRGSMFQKKFFFKIFKNIDGGIDVSKFFRCFKKIFFKIFKNIDVVIYVLKFFLFYKKIFFKIFKNIDGGIYF